MERIIYSKYSNERSRDFAIRTDILEGEQGRWVQKKALYPQGKKHIETLCRHYGILTEMYRDIPFRCNRCQHTEEGVRLEYLEKQTLEEYLDVLLEHGQAAQAKAKLAEYLGQVRRLYDKGPFHITEEFSAIFGGEEAPEGLTCAGTTNIDMVCENVMLTTPPTILDYEWTFDFPVPCQFVLYRIIHYYADTHRIRKAIGAEELYHSFGITAPMREYFEGMEAHFQKYLTGEHVPMREMFASMTPGVEGSATVKSGPLQVFFMTREGYQEEASVSRPMPQGEAFCEILLPRDCPMVRIDPGDVPCAVYLEEFLFDGKRADLKEAVVPEGLIRGKWAYLPKEDPGIHDIPVPEGAKNLTLKLQVYPGTQELVRAAAETAMENRKLQARLAQVPGVVWKIMDSKAWKLCRRCSAKRKRK